MGGKKKIETLKTHHRNRVEERCTARLKNGLKKPTTTGMMLSSLFFPRHLIPHHLHPQSHHRCGVKHTTWFGSSETRRNGIKKKKKHRIRSPFLQQKMPRAHLLTFLIRRHPKAPRGEQSFLGFLKEAFIKQQGWQEPIRPRASHNS